MRYTLFGKGTGLRVSEIALGGALFGNSWGYGAETAEATRMLTKYADAGGNFIDLADSYQFGEAEHITGSFLSGQRDYFVVATKYTLGSERVANVLTTGNSRKNMARSVEGSLRRLKTDHIDLYWVHMSDGITAMEELLHGLDDLVRAGKVLYIGLSDFPAWRIARGATIAELRGWALVTGIQVEYSLVERTPERELLPMARAFGMGITAWSPLAGGLLTDKYRRGETGRATTFGAVVHSESDPRTTTVLDNLIAVADEAGMTPAQAALLWLKSHRVIPIIGPRTCQQLKEDLDAVLSNLSEEHIARLDSTNSTPLGFPHDFLNSDSQRLRLAGDKDGYIEVPPDPVA